MQAAYPELFGPQASHVVRVVNEEEKAIRTYDDGGGARKT